MADSTNLSDLKLKIIQRQQERLGKNAQNASQLQDRFLESRLAGLEQAAALFQLQAAAVEGGSPVSFAAPQRPQKPAVYTYEQLDEFGRGDIVRCLGPAYAVYNGRRTPRIPNTDLLVMSRVTAIQGQRFNPAAGGEIEVEYDVPLKAWYFEDNSYPTIPYSIYMEIALQPCGFLSAHLGTQLLFPEQDYFFRNLDGETCLLKQLDLRGRTITTHASLLKTMVSGKQIIQSFKFSLSVEDGEPIFEGSSVFGFFPPEAMAAQIGRDSGQETLPQYEQPGQSMTGSRILLDQSPFYRAEIGRPFYRLPDGKLKLLKEVFVSPAGGQEKKGYSYANKPVDRQDWFYACHFYGDPVMPGSLGVEAILEALQAFALQQDLGQGLTNPHFELVPGEAMEWKYRGQILQSHKMMKLEVHLTRLESTPGQVLLMGNASLWADRIRIYELKNTGIRLVEG